MMSTVIRLCFVPQNCVCFLMCLFILCLGNNSYTQCFWCWPGKQKRVHVSRPQYAGPMFYHARQMRPEVPCGHVRTWQLERALSAQGSKLISGQAEMLQWMLSPEISHCAPTEPYRRGRDQQCTGWHGPGLPSRNENKLQTKEWVQGTKRRKVSENTDTKILTAVLRTIGFVKKACHCQTIQDEAHCTWT